MEATVADWITAAFTVVLAGFTAALVFVTGRYVAQTRNLVDETQKSRQEAQKSREVSTRESQLTREEMRANREEARQSRELSILPKLAIDMQTIAGMLVGLRLTNVGQGPALDIELVITFEPAEGGSLPPDVRPWRANVLARDEWLRFVPPRDHQGEPLRVPALGEAYTAVTVKGRMRDALSQEHEIDERVDDLAALHEVTIGAAVLVEKDRVPDELRRLRRSFDKAAKKLMRARHNEDEAERLPLRRRLAQVLGRSSPSESEFEQDKWWDRQPPE